MIVTKRKNIISKYDIYFAEKPRFRHWLNSYYMQAISKRSHFGFKRTAKYTKLIDITNTNFVNAFEKTVSYEIRRAKKEEIICEISDNFVEFITFYNSFAKKKDLKSLNQLTIESLKPNLLLTTAKKTDGEIIVYHSYIIDNNIKRIRLLHSCSKIHSDSTDNSEKNLIGRSNKLLHLEDMIIFNKRGYNIYDFGGYALGSNDSTLIGINKFKDSFGGVLIEESIFEAYPIYMLKKVITKFKLLAKI